MKVLDNYECEGQMTLAEYFPDLWFGKTSAEPSVPTKEPTSKPSSKKPSKLSTKMPLFLNLRRGGEMAKRWMYRGRRMVSRLAST